MIRVNKLFSFSFVMVFSKVKNVFSMFLTAVETLKKVWENSEKLSCSPKLPLAFL